MGDYQSRREKVWKTFFKKWSTALKAAKNEPISDEVKDAHDAAKWIELKKIFRQMGLHAGDKIFCSGRKERDLYPIPIHRDFLHTHCCVCGLSFSTPKQMKLHVDEVHPYAKRCGTCYQPEPTPDNFKWTMHEIVVHQNFADLLVPLPPSPQATSSSSSSSSSSEEENTSAAFEYVTSGSSKS